MKIYRKAEHGVLILLGIVALVLAGIRRWV